MGLRGLGFGVLRWLWDLICMVPDLPKISYILLGILVKLKTYSLVRVYWKVCCAGLSVWCFSSVRTGLFQSLNPKPACDKIEVLAG